MNTPIPVTGEHEERGLSYSMYRRLCVIELTVANVRFNLKRTFKYLGPFHFNKILLYQHKKHLRDSHYRR